MTAALLVLHAAATLFMTGLIWFVQVVHYPLFAAVGRSEFAAYEERHARRTGWVVAPAMLVELGTAIALAVAPPFIAAAAPARAGLALVAVVWIATVALQMPAHRRLLRGFDATVHARLVRGNWVRTAAWTARAVLALWMLVAE